MSAVQAFWAATALFSVALVVFLVLAQVDHRALDSVSIWSKPTNFAFATALHFATFALILGQFSSDYSGSPWVLALALVAIAAALFEVGYIAIQAGRGMASHFNTATPFYAAMYGFMALGALLVLLPAPVIGGLAIVDAGAVLKTPTRIAIALGLFAGTVLTVITAFRLGANGGHFVGIQPPADKLMPLTGWSLTVGDLRPAHFLATHMMQAVPVAGIVLSRLVEPRVAIVSIVAFGLVWSAVTFAVFQNALKGRPLAALLS